MPPSKTATGERNAAICAPTSWRVVDFISDLHLQISQAATFAAWQHYMAHTPADALFILGDLFEVWVGDDITLSPDTEDGAFALRCQHILQATAKRLPVYFIHGNRDFLLGERFAQSCGMTLLDDPTVLDFDSQRWLLSHGDALCLGDVNYQQFRQQVRGKAWQTEFLSKPLTERQAIAQDLRTQSESLKATGASYADVDTTMARQWLQTAQATTLIHGHTHHPADHYLGNSATSTPLHRRVLSDWDADASPPRLEVLRLAKDAQPKRLGITQAT